MKERQWLIDRRKELKLRQVDIADQLDITRSFYTQIESGIRQPSVKVAKKLGKLLEIDWTKFYEDIEP